MSAISSPASPHRLAREERQREQRTDLLLTALALKPGMVVADIGAGTGYGPSAGRKSMRRALRRSMFSCIAIRSSPSTQKLPPPVSPARPGIRNTSSASKVTVLFKNRSSSKLA